MLERLEDYHRKLHILRQIMSNKSRLYKRINTWVNILTVVVSSFLTFIGFAGITKIKDYLAPLAQIQNSTIEVIFNGLVFTIFVLVILHLVFRFGDRQSQAERSIVMLTYLINKIDDVFAESRYGHTISPSEINLVRDRYDSLLQVIPANSDREYLKAKKDYREKEERKLESYIGVTEIFDKNTHKVAIQGLIRQSPVLMQILDTLRNVDTKLFLGGGLIRNLVWDYLHKYKSPTPIDDIDVVYFDKLSTTKEHDTAIEERLRLLIPNHQWSVKNQARMHIANDEAPYTSLEDAVGKWPETATSIVARLNANDEIEIIAPNGFDDLFRLIVTPTDCFKTKIDRYKERIDKKNWVSRWPKLRFIS